jgi:hypothetical protein
MDPGRRDLYVEGQRDRSFIQWLTEGERDRNVRIIEIAFVDIPEQQIGGERARLIAFAKEVSEHSADILCFADSDMDPLWGRGVPSNVRLTDGRDLEGYVLRIECVDKVIRVGLGLGISAEPIFQSLLDCGRRLGTLRFLSEQEGLSLPFQKTKLRKYVKVEENRVGVDFDGYVTALMQNAKARLAERSSLMAKFDEAVEALSVHADSMIVHGKDMLALVDAFASHYSVESGGALLWTSFEKRFVSDYPMLIQVCNYVCRR